MTPINNIVKLAIFVEGLTEQLFIEKLITEIAGSKQILIVVHQSFGKVRTLKSNPSLVASSTNAPSYLFLIVNSGSDNTVASDIRDNYDNLAANGYSAIIGIRDVYPVCTSAEIPKLRSGLTYRIKTKPIPVYFILGVMEVEAWFIAEHTHFKKISAQITNEEILNTVGFDIVESDATTLPHPADTLNSIYQIAGLAYKKKRNQIARTVAALDYTRVYLDLHAISDLNELTSKIDDFVEPPKS